MTSPRTSAPYPGNIMATVRKPRYRWTTAKADQDLGYSRRLALRHQPTTAGALPGLDLGQVDLLTQLNKTVLN